MESQRSFPFDSYNRHPLPVYEDIIIELSPSGAPYRAKAGWLLGNAAAGARGAIHIALGLAANLSAASLQRTISATESQTRTAEPKRRGINGDDDRAVRGHGRGSIPRPLRRGSP